MCRSLSLISSQHASSITEKPPESNSKHCMRRIVSMTASGQTHRTHGSFGERPPTTLLDRVEAVPITNCSPKTRRSGGPEHASTIQIRRPHRVAGYGRQRRFCMSLLERDGQHVAQGFLTFGFHVVLLSAGISMLIVLTPGLVALMLSIASSNENFGSTPAMYFRKATIDSKWVFRGRVYWFFRNHSSSKIIRAGIPGSSFLSSFRYPYADISPMFFGRCLSRDASWAASSTRL